MKNTKNFDINDLGKNSFNIYISELKNNKKVLKMYSTHIESYLNSIKEHKNLLKKICRDIDKNSPMDRPFCFLKKFKIILNFQTNYLDSYLDKSEKLFEMIKESVDNSLKIISDFLDKSQELTTNMKTTCETYYQNYDKLIKSLEETEKGVVYDYIKNTYQINIYEEKKTDLEELINDSRNFESDFFISEVEIKDIIKKFIGEYNSNLKDIKNKMAQLNKECNNNIIQIMKIIKDYSNQFSTLSNEGEEEISNFDVRNSNFENGCTKYLNYEIKEDELFSTIKPDKYNLKIINQEEKRRKENEINKSGKKLLIIPRDIYNIVEKIYSYNIETINKDEYNLENEKEKLKPIELTGKILGFNFVTNALTKREIFSDTEKNDFIELIFSKEDYLITFLESLNNYRATGEYEMPLDLFEVVNKIFIRAADYLLSNSKKSIYTYVIILSQTFYIMKDNNKFFLIKNIKDKEFFKSIDFWTSYLDETIRLELIRFHNELSKNKIVLTEQKREKKNEEIYFSKMVSFIACLKGFEMEKQNIEKILLFSMNKYKMKEENRKSILSIIDEK